MAVPVPYNYCYVHTITLTLFIQLTEQDLRTYVRTSIATEPPTPKYARETIEEDGERYPHACLVLLLVSISRRNCYVCRGVFCARASIFCSVHLRTYVRVSCVLDPRTLHSFAGEYRQS